MSGKPGAARAVQVTVLPSRATSVIAHSSTEVRGCRGLAPQHPRWPRQQGTHARAAPAESCKRRALRWRLRERGCGHKKARRFAGAGPSLGRKHRLVGSGASTNSYARAAPIIPSPGGGPRGGSMRGARNGGALNRTSLVKARILRENPPRVVLVPELIPELFPWRPEIPDDF